MISAPFPHNKLDIYWFSGTGNTLLIALEVQRYFTQQGLRVRLLPLEQADPCSVDTATTIAFLIPVAGQSTHPFIWEFFSALPEASGTPCFLVDTLMLYSGGILGPVKKILKGKGYRPLAAREIRMPNNFQKSKEQPAKDQQLIEKGKQTVRDFCTGLMQGKGRWWDIPGYSRFLSIFFRYRKAVEAEKKLFPITTDTEQCTGCGICVALCPEGCLSLEEAGKPPTRTSRCSLCHRCFAFCPAQAVHIGNPKALRYRAVDLKTLRHWLRTK